MLQADASLKSSLELNENTYLAKSCLCYVDCEDVWQKNHDTEASRILSSFRDYAADSWHRHATAGDIHDVDLVKRVNHLFNTHNRNWIPWKEWYDLNDDNGGISKGEDSSSEDSKSSSVLDDPKNMITNADLQPWMEGSTTAASQVISSNPLCYACLLGFAETTNHLLSNKGSVNERGNCGRTPLYAACLNGNLNMVENLIDHGADMTLKNE